MLALSYQSTLRMMDIVSDEDVDNWKQSLYPRIEIYQSHQV